MHSPHPLRISRILACSILSLHAASLFAQPVVVKKFQPNPVDQWGWGTMVLTLVNPGATTLTNVSVRDVFPHCMGLPLYTDTWDPPGCNTAYGGSATVDLGFVVDDGVSMGGFTLPPGATCSTTFKIRATAYPCTNQTDAPKSDQGNGLPASDTLNQTVPLSAVFTGGAGTGNMGTAANWSTTLQNGMNIQIPSGLAISSIINDLSGLTFSSFEIDCSGCGITGNAVPLTAGYRVNVPGTALVSLPHTQGQDETVEVVSGFPSFTGNWDLGGFNLGTIGTGGVSFSGVISGSGLIVIDGPSVLVGTTPTFAGSVQVLHGSLTVTAPVTQEIDVHANATLTGPSETYTAIVDWDEGTLQPGSGSTVATWTTGPLTINDGTQVVINFGSNNSTHSTINSTDAVTIGGGTLKANFGPAPGNGLTYGPLITAATTRTGCPTEAVVCSPKGIEATPLCYSNVVALKIRAVDSISWIHMDQPHEGCP